MIATPSFGMIDAALKDANTAGGAWNFVMRHPLYGEFKNRVIYRKVVRPERLEYTHAAVTS
jgi:uncharacterized protein YndB with AHSA1/START domain